MKMATVPSGSDPSRPSDFSRFEGVQGDAAWLAFAVYGLEQFLGEQVAVGFAPADETRGVAGNENLRRAGT